MRFRFRGADFKSLTVSLPALEQWWEVEPSIVALKIECPSELLGKVVKTQIWGPYPPFLTQ